jgi:hypothetical protein
MMSVLLNYIIIQFETQKVDDMTSKIQPVAGDILRKDSFGHTRVNTLRNNPALKAASRVLLDVRSRQYPDWVHKIIDEFEKFRKNGWESIQRFFAYLVSLSKPPVDTEISTTAEVDTPANQQSVEDLVDHLENKNSYSIESSEKPIGNSNTSDTPQMSDIKLNSEATIGMAVDQNDLDSQEMTQFEVQEKRILRRLKQTETLDNWEAWFELASLYEKYGELDKATDINCFIMKNGSKADTERAAKNLIGLQ